ncbi:MAG: ABC transporter ATP-binding protein [Candidatus Gastranaerophilales bacterium]|nr:ABC transporter ATP-binding protein [Candidatus Gastranaerophilales bacterium]
MTREQGHFIVETSGLTKMYGAKAAVSHMDMKVREGAIYGFIGRNGAGKSTTLKMLCGLARPTSGEVRLFGRPVEDEMAARRVGCLIESVGLYPRMTARQNVVAKAKCMGLIDDKSVDRVLDIVGLSDAGNKKAGHFSMGMKQRLGIALALLGNPDLLILDEPINGLDPEGTREIRKLIFQLNEAGKTFIISSHILGELSKISTHYGIIRDGELVEQMSREVLEGKCRDYFQVEVDNVERALALILEQAPQVEASVCDKRSIRLYDLQEGTWVNRLLVENQVQVYSSGFHCMDLEEYFLNRMDNGRIEEQEEK